jgi:hypothetical protein
MRRALPYPLRERRRAPGPRPKLPLRPVRVARPPHARPDAALMRTRAAGGPDDRACYSCACGYLFIAQVTTTVLCPHCGAEQAW